MTELNRDSQLPHARNDLNSLQQRANAQRQRFRQIRTVGVARLQLSPLMLSPLDAFRRLPSRYLLHLVIVMIVPLALSMGHFAAQPGDREVAGIPIDLNSEMSLGLSPIDLDAYSSTDGEVIGDPPLPDIDAIPVPISLESRSEALAPLVVPATISGDVVRLRNGPGLDYDEVSRIQGGSPIEVLGRYGEWVQVRQANDSSVYWVAGELVNIPEAALFAIAEVPTDAIPAVPPPKVGRVIEDNLNLRDGPGTNYVAMARMNAGQDLTLIEQYQGWYLVEYGELYGWVSSEFMTIPPEIVERVPVANEIPDPNPPLVGTVNENQVNARKGPGTAYGRVNQINAGTSVDLLARHKDWFKVQFSDGTKAWVFSDLLDITPMARRRVAVTNDIPALPVRSAPAIARSGGGGASAAGVPASGDVASYAVQFVGYRYVYGGASPSSGFDCSGLTTFVYRQFGVRLPRTAASQYSTAVGAMVGSMNNLQPGDLMFYVNTGGRRGITHVSIYIGGGRMVHAMTPRYGVQVSNIWSSYWVNHYYGAIRPYR